MTLYRSKPQTVEAVCWSGRNFEELIAFAGDKVKPYAHDRSDDLPIYIVAGKDGAQEWVPVPVGHWLVNVPGDKSDIWPVDPVYFAEKYEAVGGV